jgi:type II secretory pathway component HofQ
MNNRVTSKDIYTDRATNESRRSFKKKLTHNEYRNEEEEEVNSKSVQKVKSNKAKIKRFKPKHDIEDEIPIIQPKKVTAYNLRDNKTKIKMKKFQNKEKNITSDYGYGYNNIISQDSTYNQNSDIYLSNDIKKNAIKAYANRRNNTSLNKRSYLSQRNNTNDSTNRNKKSDKLGTRIRLTKGKNRNILKY